MPQSDIEIAQQARLLRVADMARDRLGISDEYLVPCGHYKAKIDLGYLASLANRPDGKLVLVTAISPTPAGEGKTTTTVGLGDALHLIGRKAVIALREPSLGPMFGMKGGAAGGGHAQVVPMEDINLHFTGDFSAIALADNLLAAAMGNYINHSNAPGIDVRRITAGLGGPGNGFPREDGFDFVVASEEMANLCLASSLRDALAPKPCADAGKQSGHPARRAVCQHRARLQFRHRQAGGAQAGRLCGDRGRLRRRPGRRKVHRHQVPQERPAPCCRRAGGYRARTDLGRHVRNLRDVFGLRCGVSIKHFAADTEAEHALLRDRVGALGVPALTACHWAEGGRGAVDLARNVARPAATPWTCARCGWRRARSSW